jgi:toxin ParE1/3/4
MQVTISPLAELDLEAIADYIAADNPVRAVGFVRELRAQCQRIAVNPPGFRQRPELGDDIRSCTHGNYVIFFAEEPGCVTIIRILHGARDIPVVFAADDTKP